MEPIEHRDYVIARKTLLHHVENHRPGRLIVIIGLAGAGKTFVRRQVMRQVFGVPTKWPRGALPVVEVMALLSLSSYFSSKGFAYDSVTKLIVPDLRWAFEGEEQCEANASFLDSIEQARDRWIKQGSKDQAETILWSRFGELAIQRRLKVFCVEHAHGLCVNHKDKQPADHIQNLMSVMEAVGCMAVLTCVQEGYKLWQERQEIRERMDFVWLLPYDLSLKDDQRAFLVLLKSACKPFTFDPPDLPALLAPEIGLVTATALRGINSLLKSAQALAIASGRTAIRKADIESSYPDSIYLDKLQSNIEILREAKRSAKPSEVSRKANLLWGVK